MDQVAHRVYVCHGPTCAQLPVRHLWRMLNEQVEARGLSDRCELIVSGCQGRCEFGPNINVYPHLTKYAEVTSAKLERIVRQHLEDGKPVEELRFRDDY